ncbi:sugar porter family MFS transporter [Chelatococcus sp. GCM10030263]|uniref:sugar porter family MFS transporter n=1 Tax=Chelatococcus sp. GCM10030263 TaxID=3273387 RepID=UPI0036718657
MRVALIAASSGLLLGFNTAVVSGAMPSLQLTWALGPTSYGLIVSGLLIGAIVGAFAGGRLADDLGRRDVIMATAAVFALGNFCSGLAPSPAYIVGGRLIVGFAVGVISVVAPLYLAEISPRRYRGRIVGLYQLAITLGILCAYVLDAVRGLQPHEWREMFMSGAALAGALGIAALLLPDSPRWMLLHDDEQEARSILVRLGTVEVDSVIEELREGIDRERMEPAPARPLPFLRSPAGIGVALFFFQQLGGINVVIYFFPTMMMRVGLSWGDHALTSAISLGLLNCLLTVAALALVDRIGRRKLAMWSLAGMSVSLLILSLGEWLYARDIAEEAIEFMLLAGFVSYIGWFAVGMGPVCWIVISELYPLRKRGAQMSIPVMAHWTFNLVVSGSLPYILSIGITAYAFLGYALIAACGWWWARRFMPETMGLSLEKISAGGAVHKGFHP